MKNAIYTDILRTVRKTMSRFISIIAIVALGISFFAGMNAVAPDMQKTVSDYYRSANIMDIQIMSSVGITDDNIEDIAAIGGVEAVAAEEYVDGLLLINGVASGDMDGSRLSIRMLSLDINAAYNVSNGVSSPEYMNRPTLLEGAWPTAANQCLVDASTLSTPDGLKVGATISIEGDGVSLDGQLENTEYTVVGIVRSPLYVSYDRGNTSVGNGKLACFAYIPEDNFKADYHSMLWCKIAGSEGYEPYSSEYDSFILPYITVISGIAEGNTGVRAQALKATYTVEVAENEEKYKSSYAEAQQMLADAKVQYDELIDMAENGDAKIAELKARYNEMATEANEGIDSSRLELSDEYSRWETKRDEYNKAKELVSEYSDADEQYNTALNSYNNAKLQTDTMLSTIGYLEDVIATTRSAMEMLDENQSATVSDIINRFEESGVVGSEVDSIISSVKSLTAMGTAEEISAALEPQLQTLETQLASSRSRLEKAKLELAETKSDLEVTAKLVARLHELEKELASAEQELDQAEKDLEAADYDIQFNELEILSQLQDLKFQITNAETNLKLAKEKYATAKSDYESAVNDTNARLEEARIALDDAKNQLASLDNAATYVWGRDDALYGYEEYGQTINRTKTLATVFPWLFFLVAALVCLNTMTRMVDEERTQQGTMKALGYTDVQIISKYIFYALTASLIGCVIGTLIGFLLFPVIICRAYGVLYAVPEVQTPYRWLYAITGTVIAVGSTVLASFIAAYSNLSAVPSTLMRPKSPKAGKRVFLEKCEPLWRKMSFTSKVTARNVIRNKKRFVMAVIGVMGCTALMLAGFGLSDSVSVMLNKQYQDEDSICRYDLLVALSSPQTLEGGESEILSKVLERPETTGAMLDHIKVVDGSSANSSKVMESYLFVPQDASLLSNVFKLKNRVSGEEYTLNDTGVIITEKLAETLNIGVGGQITVTDSGSNTQVNVYVSGIIENYTFHYIFMSRNVYAALYGGEPSFNYITAITDASVTAPQREAMSNELLQDYRVSAVSFTKDSQITFKNIVSSLNYVVIVLIVSAGMLSVIVLFNLSNININERSREIATLKVLGFSNSEVSTYVFRENLILSFIGTVLGLIGGIYLHRVIIGVADVDVVMFGRDISIPSFFYAALLSMGFSLFVNVVLIRKLKSIDMVESLKSVE